MKIKPASFKSKLTFSYLIIVLFSFSLLAYFLDSGLRSQALSQIKASLIKEARLIEKQVNPYILEGKNPAYLQPFSEGLSGITGSRITLIAADGRVVADSEKNIDVIAQMENHSDRPEVKSAFRGGVGEEIRYSNTLKINMLYVAVPLKAQDEVVAAVRLALPLAGVEEMLFTTRKAMFSSLLFSLAIAFALGFILSRIFIRPISKLIYAGRKFSAGDLNYKIYIDSNDEIGELAATLNSMSQSLEEKISQAQAQNQELKAVFSSMVEGIIVIDKAGGVISINHAAQKIFEVDEVSAKGRPFLEAIRNNELAEIISRVLESGKFISREASLVWPVNKVFQVNASAIFERNSVRACLLAIHDITEMRRLETVRSDFIANVSHELKTPLTSIKGFVETLLEGALEDKENNRHFLEIIQEHAQRLDSLVNDLLSLSQLESKEVELEKERLDLRQEAEDIALGFKSQVKKKGIAIKNDLPAGIFLDADKGRIEQVFTNLIDNAIKFNKEKGSVRIYSQETGEVLKVIVEDTGIGIPAKDIPRIFERFYRVDKARSRQLGGTGLGLSIVKHIIELHGGTVGAESSEGLGSKFWFTLPK